MCPNFPNYGFDASSKCVNRNLFCTFIQYFLLYSFIQYNKKKNVSNGVLVIWYWTVWHIKCYPICLSFLKIQLVIISHKTPFLSNMWYKKCEEWSDISKKKINSLNMIFLINHWKLVQTSKILFSILICKYPSLSTNSINWKQMFLNKKVSHVQNCVTFNRLEIDYWF